MDWKSTLEGIFSDCWTKRKLLGLVLFWLAGILSVVGYGVLSGRLAGETASAMDDRPAFERNETGALTAWRKSPLSAAAPACKVTFDNLRAENGYLGVFKTASFKVVYVDRLQATFFPDALTDGTPVDFCKTDGVNADWLVPVDMANATEVRIRQLDWKVCQGDRPVFHVHCRHATLRSDTSCMVLRGHVTVTTPEAVLESNCVEMDVRDESIVVPGRYSLRCDGATRTGLGERFSKSLEPTDGDLSDTEGEHGWANGLQLGSF
jgi:hypothetical protein